MFLFFLQDLDNIKASLSALQQLHRDLKNDREKCERELQLAREKIAEKDDKITELIARLSSVESCDDPLVNNCKHTVKIENFKDSV